VLGLAVVVQTFPPTEIPNVSVQLPVFVTRRVYVTVAPGSPDWAVLGGARVTP
jgi:hypothetical protein